MTKKIVGLPPHLLKAARYGIGLSQRQLADDARVHLSSVKYLETHDLTERDHSARGAMARVLASLKSNGVKLGDGSITLQAKIDLSADKGGRSL